MIKDPSKRATLDQLGENKWINEGFNVSLKEEMYKFKIFDFAFKILSKNFLFRKVNKLEEVNEEEIDNALSLSSVIRIVKKFVKQFIKKK